MILQVHVNYADKNTVRGCKISTINLEFSEKFQCTGEEFYNAMTVIEVSTVMLHASKANGRDR
jgi:hypothetical protein